MAIAKRHPGRTATWAIPTRRRRCTRQVARIQQPRARWHLLCLRSHHVRYDRLGGHRSRHHHATKLVLQRAHSQYVNPTLTCAAPRLKTTSSCYPPRCSPRLLLPRPRPLLLPLPLAGGSGEGPEVAGGGAGAGSSIRAVTGGGPLSFFATSSRIFPSVGFGSAPASSFFSFPFLLDLTPAPLKAASICLDDTSRTGRPLLGAV